MPKEMKFTVFCIESYKIHRKLNGNSVVRLFADYGVFEYLNEFYDILHTASESYINNDIDIFLRSRGAAV